MDLGEIRRECRYIAEFQSSLLQAGLASTRPARPDMPALSTSTSTSNPFLLHVALQSNIQEPSTTPIPQSYACGCSNRGIHLKVDGKLGRPKCGDGLQFGIGYCTPPATGHMVRPGYGSRRQCLWAPTRTCAHALLRENGTSTVRIRLCLLLLLDS